MTKFKISGWSEDKPIETIEINRETDKCYFVSSSWGKNKERKVLKDTNPIYDTFEDAKNAYILKCKNYVDSLVSRIKSYEASLPKAKENLEKAMSLTPDRVNNAN